MAARNPGGLVYLSSVLFGKLFASNPNASVSGVLVISPLGTEIDSIIEEQFREYELTDRGISVLHLKD